MHVLVVLLTLITPYLIPYKVSLCMYITPNTLNLLISQLSLHVYIIHMYIEYNASGVVFFHDLDKDVTF